jgi:LemA protein
MNTPNDNLRHSAPARRGAVSRSVLIALALFVLLGGCSALSYNGLVDKDEAISETWSKIGVQYQRRAELIPQLVETVKGAANFEQETIIAVTEARASVGKMSLPSDLSEGSEELATFMKAQQQLGSSLSRLLVVSENYPALRANESFLSLQDQLEGTANRIAVAQQDYTEKVRSYNSKVRGIPGVFIAGAMGLERKTQLEFDPVNQELPTVDFSNFGDE